MASVSYTECQKRYQERKGSEKEHNYTVPEKKMSNRQNATYINLKLNRYSNSTCTCTKHNKKQS